MLVLPRARASPSPRLTFDAHLLLTATARAVGDGPALVRASLAALRAVQGVVPHDVARVGSLAAVYTAALQAAGSRDAAAAAARTRTALTLAYGEEHALVRAFAAKYKGLLAAPAGGAG